MTLAVYDCLLLTQERAVGVLYTPGVSLAAAEVAEDAADYTTQNFSYGPKHGKSTFPVQVQGSLLLYTHLGHPRR